MSENDPILDDIAGSLADLARRMASIETAHETLAASLAHERDVQRQSLLMLVQLLERQTDSLRRLEDRLSASLPPAVAPAPQPARRQAVVKGQVIVAKSKPKMGGGAKPKPSFAGDEIDHQISEAIGNISAMLKKKAPKRRKTL